MYSELLKLNVAAERTGMEVVRPPRLEGHSGTNHFFSFLARGGGSVVAVDIYEEVGPIEVMRSFIKAFDIGCTVHAVCTKGEPGGEAARLAQEYHMRILKPDGLEVVFDGILVAPSARSMPTPAFDVSGREKYLEVMEGVSYAEPSKYWDASREEGLWCATCSSFQSSSEGTRGGWCARFGFPAGASGYRDEWLVRHR
jgi:hypothetical protein